METQHNAFDVYLCRRGSLLERADNIIKFADAALAEKNKSTYVKYFYQYGVSDVVFDVMLPVINDKKYIVVTGEDARNKYIMTRVPPPTSPVKTLRQLKVCGESIRNDFFAQGGSIISEQQVSEIMEYLDERYQYSDFVFRWGKPVFAILDQCHRTRANECVYALCHSSGDIDFTFFLYLIPEGSMTNPIFSLFHELGHALHIACFKNPYVIPEAISDILARTCFPAFGDLAVEEQGEVIADVLAMGMMCGSPFAEQDIFTTIVNDDKKLFNKIVDYYFASMKTE